MHPIKKIQGGALLTALFIMTLVAIVATAMSSRLQSDLYSTQLLLSYDKLYLATEEVSFWAISELQNKKYSLLNAKKALIAEFPNKISSGIPPIELSGALYDLQARFNLNNLIEKKSFKGFMAFLKETFPKLTTSEQLNLAQALNHWISDFDPAQGKDGFTAYYSTQKPPYHPSHQFMTNASELRLIKDIDANLMQKLSPFVTALPEKTAININTASKKVLISLGPGLTEIQIDEILSVRGEKGIKNQQELNELIKKIDLPTDQVTLQSQYFLNIATAKTGEYSLTIFTILKRDSKKPDAIKVSIISKSLTG